MTSPAPLRRRADAAPGDPVIAVSPAGPAAVTTVSAGISPAPDGLAAAGLAELRHLWEQRYGAVPRLRSPDLLRRLLAFRLQADSRGGLDAATRAMLAGKAPDPATLLAPGTVLSREWQGVTHHVEIVAGGFLHDGQRWTSLSQIARHITGTRWNGPRFFGLRPS